MKDYFNYFVRMQRGGSGNLWTDTGLSVSDSDSDKDNNHHHHEKERMNCPCCFSSFFWISIVGLIILIQILNVILKNVFKALNLEFIHKWIARSFLLITSVLVVLIAVLASSNDLQAALFAKIADVLLLKEQAADGPRCDLIRNVHGRVLEIGPGPGTNFRCWGNNSQITEWVGVEPNTNFKERLESEKIKKNITFPTRTVWMKGEDYDVDAGSFDFVVATHILCSIDNIPGVIHQIKRALKPNGVYYFMEHVQANPSTSEYILQQISQPLITLVGNGCKFKEIWKDISEKTLLKGYQIEMEHKDLPMSMSFFSPHIIGHATKPASS